MLLVAILVSGFRLYGFESPVKATWTTSLRNASPGRPGFSTIGALKIRIGFWGILYYHYNKGP